MTLNVPMRPGVQNSKLKTLWIPNHKITQHDECTPILDYADEYITNVLVTKCQK